MAWNNSSLHADSLGLSSAAQGFDPYAEQRAKAASQNVDAYGNQVEGGVDPSAFLDQAALAKLGWTGGNGYDLNQGAMSQDRVMSLRDNPAFTAWLVKNKYKLGGGSSPGDGKHEGYLTDPSGKQFARGGYTEGNAGWYAAMLAAEPPPPTPPAAAPAPAGVKPASIGPATKPAASIAAYQPAFPSVYPPRANCLPDGSVR